jgi:hypothetical protein
VYDDVEWLAYKSTNASVGVLGFSSNIDQVDLTIQRVLNLTDEEIRSREVTVLKYRQSHYTFVGVIDQISKWAAGGDQGSDLRCQRLPATERNE